MAKTYYVIRKKGTELYCENARNDCRPAVSFAEAHLFTPEDDLGDGDLLADEEAVAVVLSPGEVVQLRAGYNIDE